MAPGFLADAGQTYVLEYASKQDTAEPDAVTVREVFGATREPLSLAYRALEARADRYGLGGEDLLEDRAGRTIRVFEGLVLPYVSFQGVRPGQVSGPVSPGGPGVAVSTLPIMWLDLLGRPVPRRRRGR